jgi:hypothetical protein
MIKTFECDECGEECVSFDFEEATGCMLFPRDDRFLLPTDPSESNSLEVGFPRGTKCRIQLIDTKDDLDPFVQIDLSNALGEMCFHLSTRAARELRDAIAQTLAAEETSGEPAPRVERPVALILDTVHESVQRHVGTFRLRHFQHRQLEQPDIVLVTDWRGDHDVDSLVREIRNHDGMSFYHGRQDNDILIVHSPHTMIWTNNGHVRCETWNRYDIGHGISRTSLSREQVVELIGHELEVN